MATRGRKVLLGCGVGCLTAIALSIGACVSFTVWVNQPGELLEPTRLLGSDTTGYIEWTWRIEDPGTEAFVESLLELQERAQARNPGRAPAWLNQLINSNRKQNNAQAVRQLLPTVVAWTLRPGETDDSDLHLFTLSIKSLGNRSRFFDLMLRYTLGLKNSVKHGDERIYVIEDEGALFIRNNSYFITNSEANARLIVDRMRAERWDVSRDPTALEFRLSEIPDDPLRGAISNTRGELRRIWHTISESEPDPERSEFWNTIYGATLSGSFTGQTTFEGAVEFLGPDAEWAQANAEAVLEMLRANVGQGHLQARLEAEAVDEKIRISIRVDDVFAFLDEL